MDTVDLVELAEGAGLSYVDDRAPGIRRVRRGRGFSYHLTDGSLASDRTREWAESLVIPPAWDDVWISLDRSAHILATGVDDAGRKQYIYHPIWEELRDLAKFERTEDFGARLPILRKTMDADLRSPGLGRDKVVALAVAVLDRTLIRVGNVRYAEENDSYGLTTLRRGHVEVDGDHVLLEFTGKGGAEREVVFADRRLARLVASCRALGGDTLFSHESPDGPRRIGSEDVNGYLSRTMRGPFTAKDFRTWGASAIVVAALSRDGGDVGLLEAIDVAAERLGNSRTVCRDSYVHPAITEAHADGRLEDAWRRARRSKWLDREEWALNYVLADAPGLTAAAAG